MRQFPCLALLVVLVSADVVYATADLAPPVFYETGSIQEGVAIADVLRSTDAADFTAATCVEAGGTDRVASDAEIPSALFAYLVRVKNACAANAGTRSNGAPRIAPACP